MLACAAPHPPLSLGVREELSYCLGMREVELVDEDTVIGVLDCYVCMSVECPHSIHQ
jgi:hypothetical protein